MIGWSLLTSRISGGDCEFDLLPKFRPQRYFVSFSPDYIKLGLGYFNGVHRITLPIQHGTLTLTGNLNVLVQDNRYWNQDIYEIRIAFDGVSEHFTHSNLALEMDYASYRSAPIFIPAKAAQGSGGVLGLVPFPNGILEAEGVRFEITWSRLRI